jgi:hypothetical protein
MLIAVANSDAGKGCEGQKVQLSRTPQTDHFVRDLFACISVHHALAHELIVVAKRGSSPDQSEAQIFAFGTAATLSIPRTTSITMFRKSSLRLSAVNTVYGAGVPCAMHSSILSVIFLPFPLQIQSLIPGLQR